jgi:hypothetical protein
MGTCSESILMLGENSNMKTVSVKDKKTPAAPARKAAIRRKAVDGAKADVQRSELRSILTGTLVRAKLRVGSPDDAYEREADAVADRVMRMPADEIRRKPT